MSQPTDQSLQLSPSERIIVALDFPTVSEARKLTDLLGGNIGFYKIGLELLFAGGLELAADLIAEGRKVFLDAKLLDIGNTVERSTANIAELGAQLLTVHGTDRKTMQAAVRGRGDSKLKLMAVTVMTNITSDDLAEQGVQSLTPGELVLRRARMAHDVGFDGVISSAQEAAALRAELGTDFLIITPGIRLAGGDIGDQSRVMTPGKAVAAGADYLVIGRPITQAENPAGAVDRIVDDIRAVCGEVG